MALRLKKKGKVIEDYLKNRKGETLTEAELLSLIWPRGENQWKDPAQALRRIIQSLRDKDLNIERIQGYRLR